MAKQGGVRGWHAMRKDQLVKALLSAHSKSAKSRSPKKSPAPARRAVTKAAPPRAAIKRPAAPTARPAARTTSARASSPRSVTARTAAVRPAVSRPSAPHKSNARVLTHLRNIKAKVDSSKNLALNGSGGKKAAQHRDRIVVMVRDPYWLHAFWEVTRHSVERAQAAMSQDWHSARPTLRLLEVTDGGTTSASERVLEDIEIHGGVSNWYVHVSEPPKSYRLEIGYLAGSGKFFSLARSNVVSTPAPGNSDALDENWTDVAENFDKIYAMSGGYSADGNSTELQELFEERLRRPMGSPMVTRYGVGIEGLFASPGAFKFEVDAELIVYGVTRPNAHVSLRGEPVRLRPDGSFTVRMSLPNQRQVIPVVACSASGSEQRTIVLAIERNTKVMEPVVRESEE